MRPQAPEGQPKPPGALKLLTGDANPELARKIADALQEPLADMRITRFADGEIDVKIAHSVRGVDHTSRICTRLVQFRKTDGSHQLVALVGADSDVGRRFPMPHVAGDSTAIQPDALVVDRSNLELLNVASRLPQDVEVNDQRARVVAETSGP